MKSAEEFTLKFWKKAWELKYCKLTTFKGKRVLKDPVQYWKTKEKTQYVIYVQPTDYNYAIVYLFENKTKLAQIEHVYSSKLKKLIEDVWQCGQHLLGPDERNVGWTLNDVERWLKERYDNVHVFYHKKED